MEVEATAAAVVVVVAVVAEVAARLARRSGDNAEGQDGLDRRAAPREPARRRTSGTLNVRKRRSIWKHV
jgi:hypothetical protein